MDIGNLQAWTNVQSPSVPISFAISRVRGGVEMEQKPDGPAYPLTTRPQLSRHGPLRHRVCRPTGHAPCGSVPPEPLIPQEQTTIGRFARGISRTRNESVRLGTQLIDTTTSQDVVTIVAIRSLQDLQDSLPKQPQLPQHLLFELQKCAETTELRLLVSVRGSNASCTEIADDQGLDACG